MPASACGNSPDCRQVSRRRTGQGAVEASTGLSRNVGPSERRYGRIRRLALSRPQAGGAKALFCLNALGSLRPRLVLSEAAIDALSVAVVESLREDTLYSATGGGMGPGTIAALEALLGRIAMLPGALFCSATDANGAGDRFAQRHHALAKQFAVTFERLRPSRPRSGTPG
jgi:hypothetical protein